MAALLASGFADPVFDSQKAFRAVMRAMARPGSVERVSSDLVPPAPLTVAATAVCLALADFETPLWLSPSLASAEDVGAFLRFHSGAPVAREPAQAAFAMVDVMRDALDLSAFAQGVAEYPDRSATVVLLCGSIADGPDDAIAGPGIQGERRFAFSPRPADFTGQWSRNRAGFPLGVDLIVTAGDSLACLPRSVRILGEAA